MDINLHRKMIKFNTFLFFKSKFQELNINSFEKKLEEIGGKKNSSMKVQKVLKGQNQLKKENFIEQNLETLNKKNESKIKIDKITIQTYLIHE